jgi:hypothetical protein
VGSVTSMILRRVATVAALTLLAATAQASGTGQESSTGAGGTVPIASATPPEGSSNSSALVERPIVSTSAALDVRRRRAPVGPRPFGLLINIGYPVTQQIAIAKQLGVRYIRPSTALLLKDPSLSCPGCDAYRAAGLKLILTVRNSTSPSTPSTPPTDLAAYRHLIGVVIERYRPALLVVENEEDLTNYYSGTPEEYGHELAAACAETHVRRTPCTNGGLLSGHLVYAYYEHLLDEGQPAAAASFAQRAFQAWQLPNLSSASGRQIIEVGAARGLEWMRVYRDADIDFANFHWYVEDPDALEEAARYFAAVTGHPVLTNEIGQRDRRASSTRGMMGAITTLGMPYAIWLASDAHLAQGLFDSLGELRSTGLAFAAFVRDRDAELDALARQRPPAVG